MFDVTTLDFEYSPRMAPEEPALERGNSRLMIVNRDSRSILHAMYSDLPELLKGETVYLNDSRVRNTGTDHIDRRQPIYASKPGGLAAPTAGLDLTPEILARFSPMPRFLTLHPGMASFGKIREGPGDLAELGPEAYEIPEPPAAGEHVVAIGTTVVKALETWARELVQAGKTDLIIAPGHEFLAVKALVTNLHTPRDPHMLLTGAFCGLDLLREAYSVAAREGYRFSGFGDAMLIR